VKYKEERRKEKREEERGRESITYDFDGVRSAGGAFIPRCRQAVSFFLPVPLGNKKTEVVLRCREKPPFSAMRDTGNQAKYEQLLDDTGLEIRNDKERNDENATLDEVRSLKLERFATLNNVIMKSQ